MAPITEKIGEPEKAQRTCSDKLDDKKPFFNEWLFFCPEQPFYQTLFANDGQFSLIQQQFQAYKG